MYSLQVLVTGGGYSRSLIDLREMEQGRRLSTTGPLSGMV